MWLIRCLTQSITHGLQSLLQLTLLLLLSGCCQRCGYGIGLCVSWRLRLSDDRWGFIGAVEKINITSANQRCDQHYQTHQKFG